MTSARMNRRLLRHHLPIGLASLAAGWGFYAVRPIADWVARLSFASAYPALFLIAMTLAIGPIKMLAKERLAVSLDLRRDFGIWAGIVGLFHSGVGQCVHLRGRPWLYYVYENWQQKHIQPFRHDLFGFANYTGLGAALILLALLATSNDASLRKLGTPGWKQLQRWNYVCFGLTAFHTLAYQEGVESQTLPFLAAALLVMATALLLQGHGYRQRRLEIRDPDRGREV